MAETAIATIELQKSIYQALAGKYPVFEVVPVNQPLPYIHIGNMASQPDNTKTHNRIIVTVMLHTWSKGQSSVESKTMMNFLSSRLEALESIQYFDLDSLEMTYEDTVTEVQSESTTFHGVQEYTIQITKGER